MNRNAIITAVYQDKESRLERFCKAAVKGQPRGCWESLYSIVLEELCKLPEETLQDLWKVKPGCKTPMMWVWLARTAQRQATGNRTRYEREVLRPYEVNVDDEFFDLEIEPTSDDMQQRMNFEQNIEAAKENFTQSILQSGNLTRVVLESYLRGGMNASEVCRAAGVPYNYYLSQLREIENRMLAAFGIEQPAQPVRVPVVTFTRPISSCRKLHYIATHFKRPVDVPNWKKVQSYFQNRERRLYRQKTLFPINQYLPPVFRKLSIA